MTTERTAPATDYAYVREDGVLIGPGPEAAEYPTFTVEGDWFYVDQGGGGRIGLRNQAAHEAASAAAAIERVAQETAQAHEAAIQAEMRAMAEERLAAKGV